MSSIRRFKKEIRYACGDMAYELMIASHAVKGFDSDKTPEIVGEIASLQVDALSKCSFAFDKSESDFENRKAYKEARHKYTAAAFAKLHEEVASRMQAIVDKMNAAMPQEIKDAAKKKA